MWGGEEGTRARRLTAGRVRNNVPGRPCIYMGRPMYIYMGRPVYIYMGRPVYILTADSVRPCLQVDIRYVRPLGLPWYRQAFAVEIRRVPLDCHCNSGVNRHYRRGI